MVKYICKDCKQVFNKKDNYNKHLKRKYPCVQKIEVEDNYNKIENIIKDNTKLIIKELDTIKTIMIVKNIF